MMFASYAGLDAARPDKASILRIRFLLETIPLPGGARGGLESVLLPKKDNGEFSFSGVLRTNAGSPGPRLARTSGSHERKLLRQRRTRGKHLMKKCPCHLRRPRLRLFLDRPSFMGFRKGIQKEAKGKNNC